LRATWDNTYLDPQIHLSPEKLASFFCSFDYPFDLAQGLPFTIFCFLLTIFSSSPRPPAFIGGYFSVSFASFAAENKHRESGIPNPEFGLIRVNSWLNSNLVRSSAISLFPQIDLGGLHPATSEFSTRTKEKQIKK
jgi:hypothetical protein